MALTWRLNWFRAMFLAGLCVLAPIFGLCVEATLDLKSAQLIIDHQAGARLRFVNSAPWPASTQPCFEITCSGTNFSGRVQSLSEGKLVVGFENGARAEFKTAVDRGFALFELAGFTSPEPAESITLFMLPAPLNGRVSGSLNGVVSEGNFAAVMAGKPGVNAFHQQSGGAHVDRSGCTHSFEQVTPGKVGKYAARFVAICDARPSGWSMAGCQFERALDLTGCRGIRAWVHGDGKGEALKLQLYDGQGGYRDNYITIDFKGWRQVTITNTPLNTLKYNHVTALNIYYNSLPASTAVTCLVDHVEAIVQRDGEPQSRAVLLEGFENGRSPLWSSSTINLCARILQKHKVELPSFGVIACREEDLPEVMERFEIAAGLPSPRPGGVWNKQSPLVKRSYLFITNFRESEFNEALALARRGGFDTILFGQESWSHGTGHYNINRERFPDGLEGLKITLKRFKDAGFRVGLHFLAASVYPPDPYLTPVPDSRLVKGAAAILASDIDASTNFVAVTTEPLEFPAEDGGYMGAGTVLQIGDELISYNARTNREPWAFSGCRRGHLGTRPAAHKKGDVIRHLVRSYGYHMVDLDTSLLDEVAANFARVANACEIDMVYFDGSERLQGDHWYYNARLHKAFYDKLVNKSTLLQASSFSHYSWHMMARSASADGHGDLKGYLDQRSGGFTSLARNWMPLDIGWYYGYDATATPDMYEYVLAATLAYDSSMSFQVSCKAAAAHPFTSQILDLIGRYERLRLSGKVPEFVKTALRIHPELTGIKPGDPTSELIEKRREYKLVERDGKIFFQRVQYEPWHDFGPGQTNGSWTLRLKSGPARVGIQLHAKKGTITDPWIEVGGKRHVWEGTLSSGQFLFCSPGQSIQRFAPNLEIPESFGPGPDQTLSPGEYAIRFGCESAVSPDVRARITLELPEKLEW